MDIKCLNCETRVHHVTKARQFCSQKCVHKYRYVPAIPREKIYKKCNYCQKEKQIKPCRQHFKRFFCSKEHCQLFLKENAFRKNCIFCKKIFFCQPSQIKYRNRQSCSIKCRDKLRAIKAQNNRIKNGFTKHQIDRCLRYSKEAENWRKAVFKRDNFTCVWCGQRGGYLEADHIKPWAYFPELRFELSNGRTLCSLCHNKTKISYRKMRKIYAKI